MTNLTVNKFKKTLRSDVRANCEDMGWDVNDSIQRGWGFQLWCAQVLCQHDKLIETQPVDSLLYAGDMMADIVLEDTVNKSLIIGQGKYASLAKTPHLVESEVESFFSRHHDYLDRKWVMKHGTQYVKDLLGDYKDKVNDGYQIHYYFMSTGKSQSKRIEELVERINKQYTEEDIHVDCRLYDFPLLKDLYLRSRTTEQSIPDSVEIDLPSEGFIQKYEPLETLVAIVKGNTLLNVYKKEKDSLFSYNIRAYLGDKGINKDMTITANDEPSNFFYFNNGVSAVCTDFSVKDNKLTATKFQIINGAQTVGALSKSQGSSDIDVLLRLTKTKGVSTDKGINEQIIRYSNTQNSIRLSDFRTNDPIQLFLEEKINQQKATAVLPNIFYHRKRSYKRSPPRSYKLDLQDIAKLRYAFMFEPTRVLASPKDLWSKKADKGWYEKIFLVDNETPDAWDDATLNEFYMSVAFLKLIDERIREEIKKTDNIGALRRLKYHALALIGLYMRKAPVLPDTDTLLSSKTLFDTTFEKLWSDIYRILTMKYDTALTEENRTIYAMSRNPDDWNDMKRLFAKWIGFREE